MKKKIFITSMLLIICTTVWAQNRRLDSLLAVIEKTTDPEKINIAAKALNAVPQGYIGLLKKGRQDLAKAEASGTVKDKEHALMMIAYGADFLHYTPELLDAALQGVRISHDLNDYRYLDRFLHLTGLANLMQQDIRKADNYYFAAAKVALAAHDTSDLFYDYSNLESDYVALNMPDSAIFMARQEMPLTGHTDRAHYYDALKYNDRMQSALGDYGEALYSMNQPDSALLYYRRAYQIARGYQQAMSHPYLENNIAKTYFKLGKPDSAAKYAQQAYSESSTTNIWEFTIDAAGILAKIYKGRDDKKSLFYLEAEMTAKDSLTANERSRQFQQINEKDRQRERDLKTAQEKFNTRIRLYIVIAVAVALLIIGSILWRNNRKQKHANLLLSEQKEEIEAQRDNLEHTLEKLRATQTQLIQSEKMASLGELTAGIAHEIQNPLNFVNNFSEVSVELIAELKDEETKGNKKEVMAIADDLTQNLQKIHHHGKRADFIVKGMLEHSRTNAGEKQLTDMNVLCDEFLKLSYHGLRAKDKSFNADMITHFDPKLPRVNVSQQDMGRVMLNLFNNAFYAVNQKAKKMPGADYKPQVAVTTAVENGQVVIIVKDNGTGIPDAIKDKIMQPFFTTKPTGEGTGLGLSLTYDMVVKGHGGNIEVNSVEGEGSEFIIHLPFSTNS